MIEASSPKQSASLFVFLPCLLITLFAGLYTELFFESIGYISADLLGGFLSVRAIICFLSFASFWGLLLYLFCFRFNRALDFFCDYRYFILLSLFVLLVLFNINLSSIGIWASSINGGNGSGLLFGQPRIIRTDEYNVSTLWNFSQSHSGYNPFSSLLAGGNTDTRFVYNSVSWSLITLFRPSLWGYLLFGASRGLAWFWAFKYIFLFLSAYDSASVFINNRKITLGFAALITFSPLLMWWDGWDGLIFGQYLVATFSKWICVKSKSGSFCYSAVIAWLCGCYLFVLYPAWMVPFFYIFALMGISTLVFHAKTGGLFTRLKIGSLIVSLLALVACILYIFVSSSASVKAMTSTVYPGARFSTGGGGLVEIIRYGYPLFFAIQQPNFDNACSLSTIFCLFPLGTLIGLASAFKNPNKRIIPFLALQLYFFVFICFGVPKFIARITLFYNVPTARAIFPFGYLEVFLLCYSLNSFIVDAPLSSPVPLENRSFLNISLVSLVFSIVVTIMNCVFAQGDLRALFTFLLFVSIFSVVLSISLVCLNTQFSANAYIFVVLAIMLVTGLAVHPVQKGISPVDNSDLANSVQSIVKKDRSGLWAVENNPALGNYISANGARCLTTTEAYPNISLWKSLDPAGKYEKCYNRYAHVSLTIGGKKVRFKLEHEDHFRVTMPLNSLKKLGVKYLLTTNDHSSLRENKRLYLLKSFDGYYIYKIG